MLLLLQKAMNLFSVTRLKQGKNEGIGSIYYIILSYSPNYFKIRGHSFLIICISAQMRGYDTDLSCERRKEKRCTMPMKKISIYKN